MSHIICVYASVQIVDEFSDLTDQLEIAFRFIRFRNIKMYLQEIKVNLMQ